MENRFIFNAIVSSYYDIDTPEEYKEFEPVFYLKNVDVFCTGEIGIDYDVLFEAVKEQSKNLTEKEIGQIMQHFEDNSNSPECDFVTITPDKILQCTGLKDKNGKLIYEGDILRETYKDDCNTLYDITFVEYLSDISGLVMARKKYKNDITTFNEVNLNSIEVIGNIYQNKDLLK